VSLLTLLSMARCWEEAFWKPAPGGTQTAAIGRGLLAPILALAILTLGLTVGAEPVFEQCRRAAGQLLHPDEYIHAVLGR